MAIVKTISPKIKTQVHLSEALAYITKDEKVSDCYYHNCVNDTDIEAVAEEFQSTRIMLRQDKGIIASHICQSFSPEDKITHEIAHAIGKQMIERCFPDYQVVLATHKDREHIHNHFIINSVNLIDGKKFYENKSTLKMIRKVSDELCYRYNLSVIEKENAAKYSPLDQATRNAAMQGRSWKFNLVRDLDAALDFCKNKIEFIVFLEVKGYEVNFTNQNITFRKNGMKKGIRADTLAKQFGRKYSKRSIEKKLNISSTAEKPKQPQNQQQRYHIPNYDYYNQLAAVNWKRYEKKYAELIRVPKHLYANPNLFARNPLLFTLRLIRLICNLTGKSKKRIIKTYSSAKRIYSFVDYKNGKRVIGNIPYKTIVNTLGHKFLPLICFDVRFPEWSRNHVVNGKFDYDCLLYTANFPSPRENELLTLARARAIENQAYALVVNRTGVDGYGRDYAGGCAVINPHGEIEAQTTSTREEILIHSCNFDTLKPLRELFPISKFW